MKAFVVVALAIAGVSADSDADVYTIYGAFPFHHAIGKRAADSDADAYTIGQVAAGLPYHNNVYNGVAHGYTAYNAYNTFPHHGGLYHTIGKRAADADADAYTIGQVAAGLPFANAVATGHA